MISAVHQQEMQQGLFSTIFERMEEGGLFIMALIFISGLFALFLAAKGFLYVKHKNLKINRNIILINSIGLFALVLGVFGQLLKLIDTLDALHFTEGVQPNELAGGLKFTMLPTLAGCFIFLITRFFSILLNWLRSSANQKAI